MIGKAWLLDSYFEDNPYTLFDREEVRVVEVMDLYGEAALIRTVPNENGGCGSTVCFRKHIEFIPPHMLNHSDHDD